MGIFVSSCCGIVAASAVAVVLFFSDGLGTTEEKYELTESYSIEALKNYENRSSETITETSGACFIAFAAPTTSSTENKPAYQVLRVTDDGGYTSESFPVENATLYETVGNYRVEQYELYLYEDNTQKRFFPSKGVEKSKRSYSSTDKPILIYKVYIPKGSIVGETYDTGWSEAA